MVIIPPVVGQWGVVCQKHQDGTRTDLGRLKVVNAGANTLLSSDGRRWLARTGELTPPTSPPTFIRRDTRSGRSLSVAERHAKPLTIYVSPAERAAIDAAARKVGLTRSAYLRSIAVPASP
jgi:hypothetical protein